MGSKNTFVVSVFLVVVVVNPVLSELNDTCTTPDNQPGRCIALRDCTLLYTLMTKVIEKPRSEHKMDVDRFLSLAQCGEEVDQGPRHPLVCCRLFRNPPDVSNHPNLHLINHQNCGDHFGDRIHNGRAAELLSYRWMVLLAYEINGRTTFRCGGTLISERYVLTAAHCLTEEKNLVFVRLGEYDTSKPRDCRVESEKEEPYCLDTPLDINVEEKIIHPLFTSTYTGNDIGLLRLNETVDLRTSDSISTVCLPVGPVQTLDLAKNNMTVTGWGATEEAQSSSILMEANLPVVSTADCHALYKASHNYTIDDTLLCAGGDVSRQDSCNGDSGGPLKMKAGTKNKMVQFGIISYGPRRCGTIPGVYTSVSHHMKWILDHMH